MEGKGKTLDRVLNMSTPQPDEGTLIATIQKIGSYHPVNGDDEDDVPEEVDKEHGFTLVMASDLEKKGITVDTIEKARETLYKEVGKICVVDVTKGAAYTVDKRGFTQDMNAKSKNPILFSLAAIYHGARPAKRFFTNEETIGYS